MTQLEMRKQKQIPSETRVYNIPEKYCDGCEFSRLDYGWASCALYHHSRSRDMQNQEFDRPWEKLKQCDAKSVKLTIFKTKPRFYRRRNG